MVRGLINVLKEDYKLTKIAAKPVVSGLVRGMTMPLFLISSIDNLMEEGLFSEYNTDKGITWGFQAIGLFYGHVPVASYAWAEGHGLEYIGLLITTNIADYLVGAYKRLKKN